MVRKSSHLDRRIPSSAGSLPRLVGMLPSQVACGRLPCGIRIWWHMLPCLVGTLPLWHLSESDLTIFAADAAGTSALTRSSTVASSPDQKRRRAAQPHSPSATHGQLLQLSFQTVSNMDTPQFHNGRDQLRPSSAKHRLVWRHGEDSGRGGQGDAPEACERVSDEGSLVGCCDQIATRSHLPRRCSKEMARRWRVQGQSSYAGPIRAISIRLATPILSSLSTITHTSANLSLLIPCLRGQTNTSCRISMMRCARAQSRAGVARSPD